MVEEHCCGADQLFDKKLAEKDFKRYRKKGLKRSTKKLLEGLPKSYLKGRSLLDIGGGIGGIQWYALENGAVKTTDVDASQAYLQKSKEFASARGWENQAHFYFGDFIERHKEIDAHDIVALDKVVCCYPDYENLLSLAAEKAKSHLALTFPMGGFVARAIAKLGDLYLSFQGNPFRPYIHPKKKIEETIIQKGFKLIYDGDSFPWKAHVYQRN